MVDIRANSLVPPHSSPGPVRRRGKAPVQNQALHLVADNIKNLTQHVHPPVPNPAPLGLIAFGLTTCLLQMKHTRITGGTPDEMAGVDNVTLGFAMFFGGLLQVCRFRPTGFISF